MSIAPLEHFTEIWLLFFMSVQMWTRGTKKSFTHCIIMGKTTITESFVLSGCNVYYYIPEMYGKLRSSTYCCIWYMHICYILNLKIKAEKPVYLE